MKKTIAILLLGTMLLCTFFGCGSSQSGSTTSGTSAQESTPSSSAAGGGSSAEDSAHLTVWIPGTGDETYDRAFNTILEKYHEENPNVTFDLTFIPWSEFFTKLNAAFAGGVGPDIFELGYGQLGTLVANNNLLDVDSYIPSDWDGWSDITETTLIPGQKDGKTYAFLHPTTYMLLYRKDIAEQQGVSEDEMNFSNVEELMELARRMAVKENGETVMSGLEVGTAQAVSNEQRFYLFSLFMGQKNLWNDNLSANFASQTNIDALNALNSLVQDGTSLLNEPGNGVKHFIDGLSAMCIDDEMVLTQALNAFPGQVGAVAFDMDTLSLGVFMACNANTKYPEVSADLLTYFFDEEAQKIFAETMGRTPTRGSLMDWFSREEKNGNGQVIVESYKRAGPYSAHLNNKFLDLMSLLRVALEDVYYNNTDAGEALSNCAEEYNALF